MAELRVKSTGTLKLFESDNTSNITIASPASLGADRTITLPDASVTLASGTMLATDGSGASLTALNASELGSGTVPTARLGSGTASSSTVLYGDQTYKAEPGLTGWAVDGGNNDLLPASASAGIYLGVTSATATNLLNDYEFGNWTPVWGGSPTASYTYQYGDYTKVGPLVFFTCLIQGNLSGGSGSAILEGLPFTPGGTDNYYEPVTIGFTYGMGGTNLYQGFIQASATSMYILGAPSSGSRTHVNIADIVSSDCRMTVSGFYRTAS
jgi:hypothetical protein